MQKQIKPIKSGHSFGSPKYPADVSHNVRFRAEGSQSKGQAQYDDEKPVIHALNLILKLKKTLQLKSVNLQA